MALEFTAALKRIPTYPAASAYALAGPLIGLASNESPYPPLPEVIAAAAGALAGVNRYPDPNNTQLRAALSERHHLPPEQIAVGNGSCDLLLALGLILLEEGSELVYAWPSFSVYPHLEAAAGGRGVRVTLDAQQLHDLEAFSAAITAATRLVILCNRYVLTGVKWGIVILVALASAKPRTFGPVSACVPRMWITGAVAGVTATRLKAPLGRFSVLR